MASSSIKQDIYRSFIYGEGEKDTQWRHGAPPNFDVVNKLFEEGRTQEWPEGSLEEKVQRLVKSWEMEMFHKIRPQDLKTVNLDKFRFCLNGGKILTIQDIKEMGGAYNAFLQTTLPENLRIYDPTKETRESAHEIFNTVFPRGFAFEILHVYSGPPTIVYKFRHWAFMEGPFKGLAPTGDKVELFGISIFKIDKDMKIENVEFFYDGNAFLAGFLSGGQRDDYSTASIGCPFMSTK
ncbi:pathogen-related protein-like [Asparagus officinalis]|nr:pathogen-related protein-like [Asparagus officinalis]